MAVAEISPVQSVMRGYVEARLRGLGSRGKVMYRRTLKADGATYDVLGVENNQEFAVSVGNTSVTFTDSLFGEARRFRYEDPGVFDAVSKRLRFLASRKISKDMRGTVWHLDNYWLDDYRATLDRYLRELKVAGDNVAKYRDAIPKGPADARRVAKRLKHAVARVEDLFEAATFQRAQIEAGTRLVAEYGKRWDFTGG